VVFLSDSRQFLEEYIKTDNNQLVPQPSKFIICHHPTTRLCVTETSLNLSRTKPTTVLQFEAFVTTNDSSAFTVPRLLLREPNFWNSAPSFPCPPLFLATELAYVFTLIYYFGLLKEGAILFCYIVSFSCDKEYRHFSNANNKCHPTWMKKPLCLYSKISFLRTLISSTHVETCEQMKWRQLHMNTARQETQHFLACKRTSQKRFENAVTGSCYRMAQNQSTLATYNYRLAWLLK
jgi:hypothetical protein